MGRTYLLKILWAMIAWLFLGDEPRHTCRMFLGRWEPTSLRRRQNDQNTLKFGQKHHFYATILARRRQNGPRRRQTLKSGEPRSPDPGVSTGMSPNPTQQIFHQKHPKISSKTPFLCHNSYQAMSTWNKVTYLWKEQDLGHTCRNTRIWGSRPYL